MNYGKENLKKQIRFFSSKAVKKKTRAAVIAFKVFLAAAAGLFAVAVSIGVGMFRGILRSAPDLATLNMSPTATATILYDSDGNEIETLKAPWPGVVIGFWSVPVIHPGDWCSLAGKLIDPPKDYKA